MRTKVLETNVSRSEVDLCMAIHMTSMAWTLDVGDVSTCAFIEWNDSIKIFGMPDSSFAIVWNFLTHLLWDICHSWSNRLYYSYYYHHFYLILNANIFIIIYIVIVEWACHHTICTLTQNRLVYILLYLLFYEWTNEGIYEIRIYINNKYEDTERHDRSRGALAHARVTS